MSHIKNVVFSTVEKVNTYNLEQLLHSNKLINWDGYQSALKQAETLSDKNKAKTHYILSPLTNFSTVVIDGETEVYYTLDGYGRYKNVNGMKNHFSYTNMFKEVRNLLASDYYHDVDMKNAFPVIILNYCIKYNIPHTNLKYFVENRDTILETIVENNANGHLPNDNKELEEELDLDLTDTKPTGMDKSVAKMFCLTLFFGASLDKQKDKFEIYDVPNHIEDLNDELQTIIQKINNHKDFKHIADWVKEKNSKKGKSSNMRGSIFATIIQNTERQLIDILMKEVKRMGFELGAYIYDGIHIFKQSNKKITPSYLKLWAKIMTKWFEIDNAYPIELLIKPMECDDSYLETTNEFCKYQFLKQRVEQTDKVVKINYPPCILFGKYENENSVGNKAPLMSESDFKAKYRNLGKVHLRFDKNPKYFTDVWLDDKYVKQYEKIEFNPDYKNTSPNILNRFKGLEIERHIYDDLPTTQEERRKYCKVLFDYIDKLNCSNKQNTKYTIKWMSMFFQKLGVKIGTMLIFYSTDKQGVGKTTLYLVMQSLIGVKYCFDTVSLEKDLFDKFSMGRMDKLLVYMNEIDVKESKRVMEKIKSSITETSITIEPKGIDQFDYTSYENAMGSSNNPNFFEFNAGQRRFHIVDCDKSNYGTQEQKAKLFEDVYDIIGNKRKGTPPNYKILRCFYEYLMNEDISKFDPEKDVMTNDAKNMIKLDLIDEFLTDYLHTLHEKHSSAFEQEKYMIDGKQLFKEFKHFVEKNSIKNETNAIQLGLKLKNKEFLEAKKTKSGIVYIFDIPAYSKYYGFDTLPTVIDMDSEQEVQELIPTIDIIEPTINEETEEDEQDDNVSVCSGDSIFM